MVHHAPHCPLHCRLVRVYGACTRDRANVCLIMELMEGGNLFQRIYDHSKRRMSYLEILQVRYIALRLGREHHAQLPHLLPQPLRPVLVRIPSANVPFFECNTCAYCCA